MTWPRGVVAVMERQDRFERESRGLGDLEGEEEAGIDEVI